MIKEVQMSGKSFKTEYEKQDAVLNDLHKDFIFPVYSTMHAIESSRRTAYKDTASAALEIVDNAIEAGAGSIHIVFDQAVSKNKKKKLKNVVNIAFIDNGAGMNLKMLRFALSWGGGIHHKNPEFIGKFGFGLPNASVNQTPLADVYSRRQDESQWLKGTLDIKEVAPDGTASIPVPVPSELPKFVKAYIDRNKIELNSGTVVVWNKPDHLTFHREGNLKQHLVDRFGIVYRYLLKDTTIIVNGTKVESIDPLFMLPEGRYYRSQEDGGATVSKDKALVVKYYRDPDTQEPILEKITDESSLPEVGEQNVKIGTIRVKTIWLHPNFAGTKRPYTNPVDDKTGKRNAIRANGRNGISFVRGGREIEVTTNFPRDKRAVSSGLGTWPKLQQHAYFFGMEVSMDPELDDVFGITNDKQGVRPIPDFWRLMASEGFDKNLSELNSMIKGIFKDLQDKNKKALPEKESKKPTPAEIALATADKVRGKKPKVPDHRLEEVKVNEEKAAKERLEENGSDVTPELIEEAKKTIKKESTYRPYRVLYEDVPGGPFYRPEWPNRDQKVVYINKTHPFFTTLYLSVLSDGSGRAKQAIDALLLCLAKAELTSDHEHAQLFYETQRVKFGLRISRQL